jgi:hypothetical protein
LIAKSESVRSEVGKEKRGVMSDSHCRSQWLIQPVVIEAYFATRRCWFLRFKKRGVDWSGVVGAEIGFTSQAEEILKDVFVNYFTKTNAGGSADSTADKRTHYSARQAA